MNTTESLKILDECIAYIDSLSQEEFDVIEDAKGLDKKDYGSAVYEDDRLEIII